MEGVKQHRRPGASAGAPAASPRHPPLCAHPRPLPLPALPSCPQHIRDITDPEHPYTLEQLNVVAEEQVEVDDPAGTVKARTLCWLAAAVLPALCCLLHA